MMILLGFAFVVFLFLRWVFRGPWVPPFGGD
jgi:hypothetical protein